MPSDPGAQSKWSDPDWRSNWKWVLLRSTCDRVCYPVYFKGTNSVFGMRLLYPLQTHIFAMRIGNDPFKLVTIDGDGEVCAPEFLALPGIDTYLKISLDISKKLLHYFGEEITYI